MSDVRIRVTVLAQAEAFVAALKRATRALSAYFGALTPGQLRALRRITYGRHNLAFDVDGRLTWWQSDLCAAWLHESCPAPDLCDCRCRHAERKAAR